MSLASKLHSLRIDPDDQEEAIGGWSKKGKKATRVENKGDNKKKESSQSKKAATRVVENRGDYKIKGGRGLGCQICSSTRHSTYNCSWMHRIPYDVVHIPELGPFWVIVCMDCGNKKNYPENCKECPKCGSRDRYVSPKACVACHQRGHFDNYDEDCKFFGMRGENNPFRMTIKRALEKRGLDPNPRLGSPYL